MSAGAQSEPAVNRVIIVLRNQVSNLPATRRTETARHAAVMSVQAPIASQLAPSGARSVHRYTLINAISATVSSAEKARLEANPAVSEVVPDQPIHLAPLFKLAKPAPPSAAGRIAPAISVCPPAGQVQLNPEALSLIHADSQNASDPTARKLGFDGSGVVVGFIADGLDINNPDFIRPNGQRVFIDDLSGLPSLPMSSVRLAPTLRLRSRPRRR